VKGKGNIVVRHMRDMTLCAIAGLVAAGVTFALIAGSLWAFLEVRKIDGGPSAGVSDGLIRSGSTVLLVAAVAVALVAGALASRAVAAKLPLPGPRRLSSSDGADGTK
jgi:hypothetical protein